MFLKDSPRDFIITTSNGSRHDVNMTLEIGDALVMSARANPPAQYRWARITGNGDTLIEDQQLNITAEMIGWNLYTAHAFNTPTKSSTGSLEYTVEFFVGRYSEGLFYVICLFYIKM